jgi:hypothetical protein
MEIDCINCPNCGAVRELEEKRCPYCGTPYPRPKRSLVAEAAAIPEPVTIDTDEFARVCQEVERGLITPNEARRRLGLRHI